MYQKTGYCFVFFLVVVVFECGAVWKRGELEVKGKKKLKLFPPGCFGLGHSGRLREGPPFLCGSNRGRQAGWCIVYCSSLAHHHTTEIQVSLPFTLPWWLSLGPFPVPCFSCYWVHLFLEWRWRRRREKKRNNTTLDGRAGEPVNDDDEPVRPVSVCSPFCRVRRLSAPFELCVCCCCPWSHPSTGPHPSTSRSHADCALCVMMHFQILKA